MRGKVEQPPGLASTTFDFSDRYGEHRRFVCIIVVYVCVLSSLVAWADESSRLWVVQEAYFAVKNTCYWGSEEFPLEHILNVAMVSTAPVSVRLKLIGHRAGE